MRIIIKRMEDVSGEFEDFSDNAKEVEADMAFDNKRLRIVCEHVMIEVPKEIFTGLKRKLS